MIDLHNLNEIKKLDPKNVFGSTGLLVDQLKQIWNAGEKVSYPQKYRNVKNIVICGMGGSSYGGRIVQSLFKDTLTIPIYTNDDYHLPQYVNEVSLVIPTSYSGTTEESLSCTQEAIDRKAKVAGLTSGGALAAFLKKNHLPGLIFEPRYNPSGQPRLGPGYIVGGTISILANIGLLNVTGDTMRLAIDELIASRATIKSKAIEFSQRVYGNIPLFFGGEFLKGNVYIIRNQINETAKSFSAFSELPDLNHHLIEGLKNPNDKKLIILFITSDLYSDVIKKRVQLTQEVVKKNGISWLEYKSNGTGKLSQMFDVLSFGGYLSVYLAFLYGQDPSLIPWVDFFKEKLTKS